MLRQIKKPIGAPPFRSGPFLVAGFAVALSLYSGPAFARAQSQPAEQAPSRPTASLPSENLPAGSPDVGKELFAGQLRFHNGGPACASCHSIASLPFPNGGTLGPDLTGVARKLGPHGLEVATKTLYFHVMSAIYDPHPLTLSERADLMAFFEQSTSQPKQTLNTQIIALIAFIGFLILLAIAQFVWRNRLKSVRRKMVERAARGRRSFS